MENNLWWPHSITFYFFGWFVLIPVLKKKISFLSSHLQNMQLRELCPPTLTFQISAFPSRAGWTLSKSVWRKHGWNTAIDADTAVDADTAISALPPVFTTVLKNRQHEDKGRKTAQCLFEFPLCFTGGFFIQQFLVSTAFYQECRQDVSPDRLSVWVMTQLLYIYGKARGLSIWCLFLSNSTHKVPLPQPLGQSPNKLTGQPHFIIVHFWWSKE